MHGKYRNKNLVIQIAAKKKSLGICQGSFKINLNQLSVESESSLSILCLRASHAEYKGLKR